MPSQATVQYLGTMYTTSMKPSSEALRPEHSRNSRKDKHEDQEFCSPVIEDMCRNEALKLLGRCGERVETRLDTIGRFLVSRLWRLRLRQRSSGLSDDAVRSQDLHQDIPWASQQ